MKKIALSLITAAVFAGPAQAGGAAEQLFGGAKTVANLPEPPATSAAPAPGMARAGQIPPKVYINDKGCSVAVVDDGQGGSMLFVSAPGGKTTTIAIERDLASARISAFCRPAAAGLDGSTLTVACGPQENFGYRTRGKAVLDLRGGLSALSVLGEVRVPAGWHSETEISCRDLRPRQSTKVAATF